MSDTDLGDSCAETGRMIVLCGGDARINLHNFITPSGFIRHPRIADENDFTSDQCNYLLMAAQLTDPALANDITTKLKALGWRTAPGKRAAPALFLLAKRYYHLLALASLVQMGFNALPFRWHDGHEYDNEWSWFRRTLWRWTSSEGSTVSYMTTYVTAVFLRRVGVVWFSRIFPRERYLTKALEYYAPQPDVDWFLDFYRNVKT